MTSGGGAEAHAAGVPLSACPFEPGDPDGHLWRAEWIAAEAMARRRAGSFGVPAEQYRAMGLDPRSSEHDAAARVLDALHKWVTTDLAHAMAKFTDAVSTFVQSVDWQRMFVQSVDWQRIADALSDTTDPVDRAEALRAMRAEIASAGQAVRPRGLHKPCPRHGPVGPGGNCQRCQRDAARASARGHRR